MIDWRSILRASAFVVPALASLIAPVQVAYAQSNWPRNIYDPAEADGLLLLPLPCGGTIAFRRVVTGSFQADNDVDLLSDRPITMGRAADLSRGFIEYRRPEHLTGSLTDVTSGERFYLIGAYEVTVAQYKAVMADPANCPETPQRKDTLPIADVSWYDAVEFTRRLNQWVYSDTSNHLATLSQLGVDNGFIRLPTEAEWEFATRGGLAVSEAQINEPLFFGEGALNDYAWYNAATSSGGKIKPVGGKKPNPLGLYDVYGNVEEIVLEPFRMTRGGRLHGGVGGFVTRGGSFLDQAETLTSARRDERPFFDVQLNGEFKRRTQGFRVVVSTSSVPTDLSQVPRLEAAAQELQRQEPGSVADQPTEQLARAAEQVNDRALRTEIETLNARLAAEFARRNELEATNLKSVILNAAIVTREMFLNLRTQKNLGEAMSYAVDPEEQKSYRDEIDAHEQQLNMFLGAYISSLENIGNYDQSVIDAQARNVKLEFRQQGQDRLETFVDILGRNLQSYERDGSSRTIVDYMTRLVDAAQP